MQILLLKVSQINVMFPALPSQRASAENTLARAQSQPVISQARAEVAAHQTPVKFERSHMHWEAIQNYMDHEQYTPDHATLVRFVEDLLYHIRSQEHVGEHTSSSYEPQLMGTNAYPEHSYGYPPAHAAYPAEHAAYPAEHAAYPAEHAGSPPTRRHTDPGYGIRVPTSAQQRRNFGLTPPGEFTMSLGFTSSSAVSPDGGDI